VCARGLCLCLRASVDCVCVCVRFCDHEREDGGVERGSAVFVSVSACVSLTSHPNT